MKTRVEWYNRTFKDYPPLCYDISSKTGRGWAYGYWMLGQNYQSKKKYYGEYPPGYLKRIYTLFPHDAPRLHLFSGSIDAVEGITFDIKEEITLSNGSIIKPEIVGDAHELSTYFPTNWFDLIIADPPYSEEDALRYGTPMINRNKVVKQCYEILEPGGYLVWLDQVWPMFRKDELELVGTIGVCISTNHRVRTVFIFKKVE